MREKWKYDGVNVKLDQSLKLVPRELATILKVEGDKFAFLNTIKQTFKQMGFRGRIPYADRYDKEGKLQITWMCHLHYYFHRDVPNYVGCPFQIQWKGSQPGDCTSFQAVNGIEYHTHEFETGVQYSEKKALLQPNQGRGRKSLLEKSRSVTAAETAKETPKQER